MIVNLKNIKAFLASQIIQVKEQRNQILETKRLFIIYNFTWDEYLFELD